MIEELQLTVQVNMTYSELDSYLTSKGLKKISSKYQKDIFMVNIDEEFATLADFEKLTRSVIIRDTQNEFKGYLYKKRTYDISSSTLKTSSIKVDLVNIEQGIKFLEAINYQKFFELNQQLVEYANDYNKICVSVIPDLGLFVEIHGQHGNYVNGHTIEELRRILDAYVPNIINNDYYVNKPMLMINKLGK